MPVLIADTGPDPSPSGYTLPAAQAFRLQSVNATFDGSGAAGDYLPCLSLYAQSGELLTRTFPAEVVDQGDSAEVSYVPFGQAE